MDIAVIRMVAPLTPKCFADRLAFAEYLHASMQSKSSSTRPFDASGNFNIGFSWCSDCTTDHRRSMVQQGRCHPPMAAKARAVDAVIVKEPAGMREAA